MSIEHTQDQSDNERKRAAELSLRRTRPPIEIAGYEPQRFLGAGAYGEVWVALDVNTRRPVAIKYYLHRGGLDTSLLEREVGKLAILSADRYVVQVLDVGWHSNPPYYVMEFIEQGSLDDYLRESGALPISEAVQIFRGVATGLNHSHAKGVLHCDLKPANILLDEDHHPRLADFGQSRFSKDQAPALGTLFYMAPEQADLQAVPDAKWDVYALGAMLCTMLTGAPPYRSTEATKAMESAVDLEDRLARYRNFIRSAPKPTKHHLTPGMDSGLIEIIDRCIAVDPEERFSNVQEVIDALQQRDETLARWPLMVMGLLSPAIVVLIALVIGWRWASSVVDDTQSLVITRVRDGNRWAAKAVADSVGTEIERYFRAVERVAEDPELRQLVIRALEDEDAKPLIQALATSEWSAMHDRPEKLKFTELPSRQPLQQFTETLMENPNLPKASSWFVASPEGLQIAAAFPKGTESRHIGRNFSWRSYFHGGTDDLEEGKKTTQHIARVHLSGVYRSSTTNTWKVAISVPIYRTDEKHDNDFLGVLALSAELGTFLRFESSKSKFAALVDNREGKFQGVILQHPVFTAMQARNEVLPDAFSTSPYRIDLESPERNFFRYVDPIIEYGQEKPKQEWILGESKVEVPRGTPDMSGRPTQLDTGLVVLVQEDREEATSPVRELGSHLVSYGLVGLLVVLGLVTALWFFVVSQFREPIKRRPRRKDPATEVESLHSVQTVSAPSKPKK